MKTKACAFFFILQVLPIDPERNTKDLESIRVREIACGTLCWLARVNELYQTAAISHRPKLPLRLLAAGHRAASHPCAFLPVYSWLALHALVGIHHQDEERLRRRQRREEARRGQFN